MGIHRSDARREHGTEVTVLTREKSLRDWVAVGNAAGISSQFFVKDRLTREDPVGTWARFVVLEGLSHVSMAL
jgi:hypothetical protein